MMGVCLLILLNNMIVQLGYLITQCLDNTQLHTSKVGKELLTIFILFI